jgi:hypothetical protein
MSGGWESTVLIILAYFRVGKERGPCDSRPGIPERLGDESPGHPRAYIKTLRVSLRRPQE